MSKDEEEKKAAETDNAEEEETSEEEASEDGTDEENDEASDETSDEEEEDEDEDDDQVAAQPVDSLHPHAAEPQDPTWWVPHAVLAVLVAFGFLGFFGMFNSFLRPAFQKMGLVGEERKEESHAPAAKPTPSPTSAPTPRTLQQPPRGAEPQGETFGARHLLVQYQGSRRAPATITRTKEDAKKRAEEALKKARAPGAKFEDVVGEYSDEPGAAQRGGNLGNFARGMMDPAFQTPLEKLKVGEISDIVETPFGFHVILRTK